MTGKGITIYPNVHSTDEDFSSAAFKELVAGSDVLFIEQGVSDGVEEQERIFNTVSRDGAAVEDNSEWKESSEALYSVLRGCKKKIYMEHSPFTKADVEFMNSKVVVSMSEYMRGEPEKSFDTILGFFDEYAKFNHIRESTMVRQLARLQRNNPEQGMLAVLGMKHMEPVVSGLLKNGCRAEKTEREAIVQGVTNDMIDACYQGRTPDALGISRAVPENMMMSYRANILHQNSRQCVPAVRRAAERLDYESSCELSKELGRRKLLSEEDKMYFVCEKLQAF